MFFKFEPVGYTNAFNGKPTLPIAANSLFDAEIDRSEHWRHTHKQRFATQIECINALRANDYSNEELDLAVKCILVQNRL